MSVGVMEDYKLRDLCKVGDTALVVTLKHAQPRCKAFFIMNR
jgi:hypothetical protein